MNILQTLGEMVGYKKYIDGYSTKIRRDGWKQKDILQKLGDMDG